MSALTQRLGYIGKYELLELIGEGETCSVYWALDHDARRHVAIKLLHRRPAANCEAYSCFCDAARAAIGIHHPNLFDVLELGEDSGLPYLVMEFSPGEPLDQFIAAHPDFTPVQMLESVIQVCNALHHVHSQGLIHGGVEPSNVIVLPNGNVKLADFGVDEPGAVRDWSQTASIGQSNAVKLRICAALNYRSPEQLADPSSPGTSAIDARTDIFSAGVLLYWLLTETLPFPGPGIAETIAKVVHEDPAPLSAILQNYPAQLDGIMVRALAKRACDRYPTAREMAHDLTQTRDAFRDTLVEQYVEYARACIDRSELTAARDVLASAIGMELSQAAVPCPIGSSPCPEGWSEEPRFEVRAPEAEALEVQAPVLEAAEAQTPATQMLENEPALDQGRQYLSSAAAAEEPGPAVATTGDGSVPAFCNQEVSYSEVLVPEVLDSAVLDVVLELLAPAVAAREELPRFAIFDTEARVAEEKPDVTAPDLEAEVDLIQEQLTRLATSEELPPSPPPTADYRWLAESPSEAVSPGAAAVHEISGAALPSTRTWSHAATLAAVAEAAAEVDAAVLATAATGNTLESQPHKLKPNPFGYAAIVGETSGLQELPPFAVFPMDMDEGAAECQPYLAPSMATDDGHFAWDEQVETSLASVPAMAAIDQAGYSPSDAMFMKPAPQVTVLWQREERDGEVPGLKGPDKDGEMRNAEGRDAVLDGVRLALGIREDVPGAEGEEQADAVAAALWALPVIGPGAIRKQAVIIAAAVAVILAGATAVTIRGRHRAHPAVSFARAPNAQNSGMRPNPAALPKSALAGPAMASPASGGQAGARPKAGEAAAPAEPKVEVWTDLECDWNLDNKAQGRLRLDNSKTVVVAAGKHHIQARSTDGLDEWQADVVVAKTKAMTVDIELQEVRQARLDKAEADKKSAVEREQKRLAEAAAEQKRLAEEQAAAEQKRQAEAEAERKRAADLAEQQRQAQAEAEEKRQATAAAEKQRQEAEAEKRRVAALQRIVWKDPATRLFWARRDNGVNVNWRQAKDYCGQLNMAGYSGWRLPTIDELQTIYDPKLRVMPRIKGGISAGDQSYWSASFDGAGVAWTLHFAGSRYRYPLEARNNQRALCVRGSD